MAILKEGSLKAQSVQSAPVQYIIRIKSLAKGYSRKYVPARNAAAPTIAKIPGEVVVTHWPIRRPNKAPASRAGMITPDGTLQPNVTVVRTSLTRVPYTSQPMYLGDEPLASFWQIHELVERRQSCRRFLMVVSPGSRVSGLGY